MARFEVYPNRGSHAHANPYLLDVHSELLDGLDSRMVIPLRSLEYYAKVNLPTRLTPVLSIQRKEFLLETPKMGAVLKWVLKSPVNSVAAEQALITAAVDFLFQGYRADWLIATNLPRSWRRSLHAGSGETFDFGKRLRRSILGGEDWRHRERPVDP